MHAGTPAALATGMKIDLDQLDTVRGGAGGAILGALMGGGGVGGVLSGVGGLLGGIAQLKAAKGASGGGAAAAAAGGAGGGYAAAAGAAYATGPAPRPPSDGGLDVSVQVAHGAAAQQLMRGA